MIRHLLLLHSSGIPLFTRSFEKGINCCSEEHKHHSSVIEKSTLFSSFLTSMNLLAGEFGGSLRHMKLGQWDVFVETHEQLTGVLLTNPSDDHKIHDKYTQALSEINSKFLEQFKLDLQNWTGEVGRFQSFEDILSGHEIMKIESSNIELCKSCIEIVSSVMETII